MPLDSVRPCDGSKLVVKGTSKLMAGSDSGSGSVHMAGKWFTCTRWPRFASSDSTTTAAAGAGGSSVDSAVTDSRLNPTGESFGFRASSRWKDGVRGGVRVRAVDATGEGGVTDLDSSALSRTGASCDFLSAFGASGNVAIPRDSTNPGGRIGVEMVGFFDDRERHLRLGVRGNLARDLVGCCFAERIGSDGVGIEETACCFLICATSIV